MYKTIKPKGVVHIFLGTALLLGLTWSLHNPSLVTDDVVTILFFFQLVAALKAGVVIALRHFVFSMQHLFLVVALAAFASTCLVAWLFNISGSGLGAILPLPAVLVLETLLSPWLLYWASREAEGAEQAKQAEQAEGSGAWRAKHYKVLSQEIRHHYLFNTLNTTVYLIGVQPKLAIANLENVAMLYREILSHKEVSNIQSEIDIAEAYLHTEQVRLGDRIQTRWSYPTEVLSTAMPSMTLQPLLENAVYHGIETLPQGGCIEVAIKMLDAKRIALSICNPRGPKRSHTTGSQRAQTNLKQRLALCYGESNFQFLKHTQPDSYRVELVLPRGGEHEDINCR